MHYLLFYDLVPDYAESLGSPAHESTAQKAVDRGELILGGALANPIDASILLFRATSPQVVEDFARGDPYVRNKVVTKWRVREWTTVIGKDAQNRV